VCDFGCQEHKAAASDAADAKKVKVEPGRMRLQVTNRITEDGVVVNLTWGGVVAVGIRERRSRFTNTIHFIPNRSIFLSNMAAVGATWAQVRQQARAAETHVGDGNGKSTMTWIIVLTEPLDRIALPHIRTIRRKVRCRSKANRGRTEDGGAVE
jgi:hypothetical protein